MTEIYINKEVSLNSKYKKVFAIDTTNILNTLKTLNNKEYTKFKKYKDTICFLFYENIEQVPSTSLDYWKKELEDVHNIKEYDIYINDKTFYNLLKQLNFKVYRYYPSDDFVIYEHIKKPINSIHLIKKHFTCLSNSRHDHNYYIHKFLNDNLLLDKTIYSYKNEDKKFKKNYNRFLSNSHVYDQFIEKEQQGSIFNNQQSHLDLLLHIKSAFTINKETVFHGHGPYYSEKLAKCLAAGRPFIEVSSPHTLKDLKETFGIKTFDDFVDESYDNEEAPQKRIDLICSEIRRISNIPLEEIVQYIESISDRLQHNFKIGQALYNNKYLDKDPFIIS